MTDVHVLYNLWQTAENGRLFLGELVAFIAKSLSVAKVVVADAVV